MWSSRRIAALKVRWKLEEGHWSDESEWMTTDTRWPANTNSTFGCVPVRDGSLRQDLSNSVLSIGVLSSATNLCIESTSRTTVDSRMLSRLRGSPSNIADFRNADFRNAAPAGRMISCFSFRQTTTTGESRESWSIHTAAIATAPGRRHQQAERLPHRHGGTWHRELSRRCALQALHARQQERAQRFQKQVGGQRIHHQ